jgi:hypothetical protein
LRADLGNKALDFIEKWRAGGEMELGETLRHAVEQYDMALQRKVRTPNVELSWEDMMEEETNDDRLALALRALRESAPEGPALRRLRHHRHAPDRGKTTLVASEVTYSWRRSSSTCTPATSAPSCGATTRGRAAHPVSPAAVGARP